MFNETISLVQLGWRPFYSQQLTLEDLYDVFPARVAGVQRTRLRVFAESGEHQVTLPARHLHRSPSRRISTRCSS